MHCECTAAMMKKCCHTQNSRHAMSMTAVQAWLNSLLLPNQGQGQGRTTDPWSLVAIGYQLFYPNGPGPFHSSQSLIDKTGHVDATTPTTSHPTAKEDVAVVNSLVSTQSVQHLSLSQQLHGLELLFHAALATRSPRHVDELAWPCLQAIVHQVLGSSKTSTTTSSQRITLLRAAWLEAKGQSQQAIVELEEFMANHQKPGLSTAAADPAYPAVLKRLIALSSGPGHAPSEAIDALVKYLDIFMGDAEAWMHLCKLYLAQNMYQQAAFCVEELLLLRSHHPLLQCKYAEIMGVLGQWSLALKYYCTAVEMELSLRGLYGICVAVDHLLGEVNEGNPVDVNRREMLEHVRAFAKSALTQMYTQDQGQSKIDFSALSVTVNQWLACL